MDYYQGVVSEYLRANRATFINPEFCLQLHGAQKAPEKGSFWYVDLLAVNFSERTVYLCEVTYSNSLAALLKRLGAWGANWDKIVVALARDTDVPSEWAVRPWIFVPEQLLPTLISSMPPLPVAPRVTPLEMTVPWKYCGWDRRGEASKPSLIPASMM